MPSATVPPVVEPLTTSVDDATYSAYQKERALSYQAALKRAGGEPTSVDEAGRTALAELVASVRGKLPGIIIEKITERFGGRYPAGTFEECEAVMLTAIIESASRYDPARCASFNGWVTAENGPARKALYACLDVAAGLEGFDRRALHALRVARGSAAALLDRLGRRPSLEELKDEMRDYAFNYQFERLTPEQQSLPTEQWQQIARAKLVKSSMLANIERIGELLAAAEPVVHADAAETGWDHFEQSLSEPNQITRPEELGASAALVPIALAGLRQEDRDLVCDALVGSSGSSLTQLAEVRQVPVSSLRALVTAAKARMQAGHAHYALLAPGVAAQFEQALEPRATSSAAAPLLERLVTLVPA